VVRIANGSRSAEGRITEVRAPKKLIVNIQIVEYLRAFLAGRVGWSRLGGLLIISGAFGLFRREAVLSVGGYARGCVGEDAELVVRLHRRLRERREAYRVVFVADPVCWTQAPTGMRVLGRQRDRWQRGLWETLLRHRRMIGRPRYGVPGLLAMPYFLVFEALGPIVEVLGLSITAFGLATGRVSPALAATVFALSISFGLILSFGALLIEERGFRRYRSWPCTLRLTLAAVLENVGYRQWLTLVRVRATFSLLLGKGGWGEMPREAFDRFDDVGLPLAAPPISLPADNLVAPTAH
jgi:cellulose synthase/poly-beta-1,6-N-acetylglucosamine synthase-like glycosyltransferase